jgi:RHS repeat-associated protein
VAQYRYNGLGFQIGRHWDLTRSGGGSAGRDRGLDTRWRVVATFRSTDSDPKERFVHHNAGLGGQGGSSYIDAVVLRERDANTAWYNAADSTAEERRLMCEAAPRPDVVAVLTDTGNLVESVKCSSYGVAFGLPVGDTDSDGDWDATDSAAITGAYAIEKDANLDGVIDASDVTYANSITGGYQTLGRTVLSSSGVNSRTGYASYQFDPTFTGAGRSLSHARNRVFDANLRWLSRDKAGYIDGPSLFSYVRNNPLRWTDPNGRFSSVPLELSESERDCCASVGPFGPEVVGGIACSSNRDGTYRKVVCSGYESEPPPTQPVPNRYQYCVPERPARRLDTIR